MDLGGGVALHREVHPHALHGVETEPGADGALGLRVEGPARPQGEPGGSRPGFHPEREAPDVRVGAHAAVHPVVRRVGEDPEGRGGQVSGADPCGPRVDGVVEPVELDARGDDDEGWKDGDGGEVLDRVVGRPAPDVRHGPEAHGVGEVRLHPEGQVDGAHVDLEPGRQEADRRLAGLLVDGGIHHPHLAAH